MNNPHPNLWYPYAQMKHLDFVPKAVKTLGSEITLDNSEVLIDGVASCGQLVMDIITQILLMQ